jgi:hypothetical protein
MARIRGSIVVDRPVEVVFDHVADVRNEPGYNPGMLAAEKLTPGPVGPGTRFRATMDTGRHGMSMSTVLTEYHRPSLLGSVTTMPVGEVRGTLRFDPVPGGTRMSWDWALRPRGWLRLVSPLLGRVGGRQEAAIWAGLKRHLEATGDGGPR